MKTKLFTFAAVAAVLMTLSCKNAEKPLLRKICGCERTATHFLMAGARLCFRGRTPHTVCHDLHARLPDTRHHDQIKRQSGHHGTLRRNHRLARTSLSRERHIAQLGPQGKRAWRHGRRATHIVCGRECAGLPN